MILLFKNQVFSARKKWTWVSLRNGQIYKNFSGLHLFFQGFENILSLSIEVLLSLDFMTSHIAPQLCEKCW